MAAHLLLNDIQFYHGTGSHIQGSMITPGHRQANLQPVTPGKHDRSEYLSRQYSYAATDPAVAFDHAAEADVPSMSERRQVVRVRPIGIPRRDPEDDQLHPTSFMSRQGWQVQPGGDEHTKRYNRILRESDDYGGW